MYRVVKHVAQQLARRVKVDGSLLHDVGGLTLQCGRQRGLELRGDALHGLGTYVWCNAARASVGQANAIDENAWVVPLETDLRVTAQQAVAELDVGQARKQAGGKVGVTSVMRTLCGGNVLHDDGVVIAQHTILLTVRTQLRERGTGAC